MAPEPVEKAARMDMSELGTTGLKRSGGYISDEFLTMLRGERGRKVYREMSENDPIVGAVLFAIDKIVCRLDWEIRAHEEVDDEDERVEFVQSCLDDMSQSFDATLSDILSMCVFGWSYHEIVYKRRVGPSQKDPSKRSKHTDGKIGWRKWGIRSQETLQRWQYAEDGSLEAMLQLDPNGAGLNTIPIEKSLLFRVAAQKNSPEGKSMLRTAFTSWYYKKRAQESEAVGMERDLAGLPVAWVPPEWLSINATPEQKAVVAEVTNIVQNIKRGESEGTVFPLMYKDGQKVFDLTLLNSGGRRQYDTDTIISRYDQRIAQSVLADFVLIGHENVGSLALGATKMDLWVMAIDGLAKSIAEVVNQHAIPRLLALNGMDMENPPRLAYGEVAHVDLAELADYVTKLVGAGAMVVDDGLEEHMRGVAGLPPVDHEDPNRDTQVEQARGLAVKPGTPGFGPDGQPLPPKDPASGDIAIDEGDDKEAD